jgi:hypothetical protein
MKDKSFESGKRGKKLKGSNHVVANREKARRHEEGEARNARWRALSDEEKIKLLLARGGWSTRQLLKLGVMKLVKRPLSAIDIEMFYKGATTFAFRI